MIKITKLKLQICITQYMQNLATEELKVILEGSDLEIDELGVIDISFEVDLVMGTRVRTVLENAP